MEVYWEIRIGHIHNTYLLVRICLFILSEIIYSINSTGLYGCDLKVTNSKELKEWNNVYLIKVTAACLLLPFWTWYLNFTVHKDLVRSKALFDIWHADSDFLSFLGCVLQKFESLCTTIFNLGRRFLFFVMYHLKLFSVSHV